MPDVSPQEWFIVYLTMDEEDEEASDNKDEEIEETHGIKDARIVFPSKGKGWEEVENILEYIRKLKHGNDPKNIVHSLISSSYEQINGISKKVFKKYRNQILKILEKSGSFIENLPLCDQFQRK